MSCDIFRGHVRTMDVHTSLGDVLTLTVDDDIEALREACRPKGIKFMGARR